MAINNWWDDDPRESFWMEIRKDPEGLGEYLRAPKSAAGGRSHWTYDLTSYVEPGDQIFHWFKTETGEPGIIGWSTAVGPLDTIQWSWQARGISGRERGVPIHGPAWNMPLEGFTRLEAPVVRSALNLRRSEILEALDGVVRAGGVPIYAPFQNYGRRELRAAQGYLVKMPAALVALLFGLPFGSDGPGTLSTHQARSGHGQGYMSDSKKRRAVERHAVEMAIEYYQNAGATEIEELGKPYDLKVVLDGLERHVEVKGSIGEDIMGVQLTQGEVDHARHYQPTDLFVVDGISAEVRAIGDVVTSGGQQRIWTEWEPKDHLLRPTHLRYTLP